MKLPNNMHELFACAIAEGKTITAAAKAAGTRAAQPHHSGWMWMQRADVQARIEEVRAELALADAKAKKLAKVEAQPAEPEIEHEPATLEWINAKHVRSFRISEARADTKEMRASLIELARLAGLYVERSVVETKVDPMSALSGAELEVLRQFLQARKASAITTTTTATIRDETDQGAGE